MQFDKLVESFLNEAPVDDISQIRSTHFTPKLPSKAKFKDGEKVMLGVGNEYNQVPAIKKYGPGAIGEIVGMQRNTGPGRTAWGASPMNRYYVKFEDGKIWPVSSFYLRKADDYAMHQYLANQSGESDYTPISDDPYAYDPLRDSQD